MIKAVLDTNVLLSALFWRGTPYHVLENGLRGNFVLVTSFEILKEVRTKLVEKFGFPEEDTNIFIEILVVNSFLVNPLEKVHIVIQDSSDDKIIECALAGKVDFVV